MSAIINDRDVWLQSFISRFEIATVVYGDQYGQLQSSNTGLSIAAAKKLDLDATSQMFTTANGSTEPPVIILSPRLRNLTGPPTYSVVSGSATLTPTGDAVSVFFATMGDRVTVRAQITDTGITYQDQVTLVKLGPTTGVVAFLTNEYHSYLADSFGNILNYIGGSGTFRVFDGVFEVTNGCAFSIISNTSNLLVNLSNIGAYSITGMPSSVDNATLTLRARYNNTDYDQTVTIVKLKAAVGTPADPGQFTPGGIRLPVRVSVPIGGTVWSDVAANALFTSVGGPVLNDQCTEYNNASTPPYKESRSYADGVWLTIDASVDGNLIVSGTITADKLAANTITTDKLAVGSVVGNIASGQIVGTMIANGTISTAKIKANAITADLIAAGTITADRLAVGVISDLGQPGTITGTMIVDGSISTAKIFANAITSDKIAANSITSSKIVAGSISADRLAIGVISNLGQPGTITGTMIVDGTVSTAKIAANAISAAKIQAGVITGDKLVAGTITADKLAIGIVSTIGGPGTITGTMIADGTITTAKIGANQITADKISVASLDAISGSFGTLTVGTLNIGVGAVITDRLGLNSATVSGGINDYATFHYWSPNNAEHVIGELTLDFPAAAQIAIVATVQAYCTQTSSTGGGDNSDVAVGNVGFQLNLYRNNVLDTNTRRFDYPLGCVLNQSTTYVITVPAGSHKFAVVLQQLDVGRWLEVQSCTFAVIGLMR